MRFGPAPRPTPAAFSSPLPAKSSPSSGGKPACRVCGTEDALFYPLFVGAAGFVLAFIAGLAIRPSGRNILALALLGVALAIGWFAFYYFSAPVNPQECSDCDEVSGRWLGIFALWFPFINLLGWFVGMFVGIGMRWAVGKARAS